MSPRNLYKIGAAATALFLAVPAAAQMSSPSVEQAYPAPAAQAVYPPCSATLRDQCTNTRREADEKASSGDMGSMGMGMGKPMHHKRHMRHMRHMRHNQHKM